MIINYNDQYPAIPVDTTTNDIDWLAVRELARQQGDWFARGASIMPVNQRLINLFYLYSWLKYSGYAHYAARAIACIMWYECGYDGSQWGTGLVRSDTPYGSFAPVYEEGHEDDPDYILYYQGYNKIVASNWDTLPASWPVSLQIIGAGNMTNPTIVSNPSYGLVQWTPYGILWEHSDLAGQDYGEDWSRAWLNDSSLQCFILDWEQEQADNTPTNQQYGANYKGEWRNDRHAGEDDIITCTWAEFKSDAIMSDPLAAGLTDVEKMQYSAHNFIVHYIHGTPVQAHDADTERQTVFNQYIDNAFTIWDNAGGAGLMDMPPPATTLDPWHRVVYTLLGGRRKKHVRTILL